MIRIITGKDNPTLRDKSKLINNVTPELLVLIRDMTVIMKESEGIGLAAPQVGKSIALFVIDPLAFDRERSKWEFRKIESAPDTSKPLAFINPVISTYPKFSESMVEGCLSLPGWEGNVIRSKRITIKAQTIDGKTFKLQAKGLLAKVLQHEYDHLQGVLICDKWKDQRRVKGKGLRVKGVVFFGDSPYSRIVLNKLKRSAYEPAIVMGKTTNYKLLTTNYSLGITAAYGKIIPQEIVKKFRRGILNIHPSLLPRYRGPSPLQQAILNGDNKTGVTIMLLNKKMDAGPLLAQSQFLLDKPYTTDELGRILFEEGAQMLIEILPEYLAGKLEAVAQDESQATYTRLITKDDGLIDWFKSAVDIERKIRAYQPWPTAYTFFKHRGQIMRLQLLGASITQNLTGAKEPGKIETAKKIVEVACGKGTLVIKKLRPEGKKEMTGEEFVRGYAPEKFFSHIK